MSIERHAAPHRPSVPADRSGRRVPRALPRSASGGGPPVTSAAVALDLLGQARSWPPRPETIIFLLGDDFVGRTCVVVDGTTDADDVLGVCRLVIEVAEQAPAVHAAVVATVRVDGTGPAEEEEGRSDTDRWLELLDAFDDVGLELVDWYIVGPDRVESLRSATGMPSLWPGSR